MAGIWPMDCHCGRDHVRGGSVASRPPSARRCVRQNDSRRVYAGTRSIRSGRRRASGRSTIPTTWTKAVASSPSTSATSYRLSRYALTKRPRGLITSWSRVGVARGAGTSLSIMKLCTLRDRVEGPCPGVPRASSSVLGYAFVLVGQPPAPVGAENSVTLCDLQVLVAEADEPISPQGPNSRSCVGGSVACGWVLMKRLVRGGRWEL